eukprot:CAMPEP_0197660138 /NCGR_PEP_ID=MMETSP1338-20131121/50668_1 /TAXON_ID=43686 ORGANISM="Pelagodinium beii, Strain RCC1491" /NCGR_SAMPLE_ID=MMETSP1338 /ASSEMBLY_ACC=CAM_ASM_000754 /LENGTH=191 /DNA_ID=CAMNT_0043237427 /DNA_START=49 /DNA_END=621 /DNA_ORIENTATION=-
MFAERLEPLLGSAEDPGASRWHLAALLLLTMAWCSVAYMASSAGTGGPETTLASGPLGLGGILGPVGQVMGMIYDICKPYAGYFKFTGILLYVSTFLLSSINHTKDIGSYVGMMKSFGLPCPVAWALGGLSCTYAGSILLLTGKPVLMEWGAELLCMFLMLATYFGHYKPMKQGGDGAFMHFLMCLKNVSL